MKKINSVLTTLTIVLLSSCGMSWESGGKEEFKSHCKEDAKYILGDYDLNTNSFTTTDIDKTCDCVIEKAIKDYPNYEDALMNKKEYINSTVKICAAAK